MILGFKPSVGGNDSYHFGTVAGDGRKFIRVFLGAVLPVLDRQKGAGIVIAENYRPSAPPSFVLLEGYAGAWPHLENRISEWRKNLKFNVVVVDKEQIKPLLWRMKGLQYAEQEIPWYPAVAPSYAAGEIGRSYANELISENRLIIPESVQAMIEDESEIGRLAIQCVVCYAREIPAYYAPLRQEKPSGQILGVRGL